MPASSSFDARYDPTTCTSPTPPRTDAATAAVPVSTATVGNFAKRPRRIEPGADRDEARREDALHRLGAVTELAEQLDGIVQRSRRDGASTSPGR